MTDRPRTPEPTPEQPVPARKEGGDLDLSTDISPPAGGAAPEPRGHKTGEGDAPTGGMAGEG